MKNIISLLVLICSIAVILVSCSKEEESTSTSVPESGTGTTSSGTVEGNSDLTGTFHLLWYGEEPSGGGVSTIALQFETLVYLQRQKVLGTNLLSRTLQRLQSLSPLTQTQLIFIWWKVL